MKHIRLFEGFDQLNEEMYTVMNVTDGVPASPEVFTEEKADKFIQEFPKRFQGQGYYLTSNKERIDPSDVKLEKVPVEGDVPEGTYEAKENITLRGQYGDFKLKKDEQIHISTGKMSKNDYTVKLPDGVTQIKAEPINDLISAGRLQPVEAQSKETVS